MVPTALLREGVDAPRLLRADGGVRVLEGVEEGPLRAVHRYRHLRGGQGGSEGRTEGSQEETEGAMSKGDLRGI